MRQKAISRHTLFNRCDNIRLYITALYVCLYSFGSGQTYTPIQQPFSIEPITAATIITVDDAVLGAYPIGFTFCFWGNKYNQFYIGSNGWVGFSSGQPIAFTPQPIPTTNAFIPKNCIMSPFHDLNPGVSGFPATPLTYISYYTTGTAPFRRLVVTWNNVPMYQCTSVRSTQQIVLFESTNIIQVNIQQKSTCLAWVNGKAILGLHSIGGTNAVVILGRNATTWNISQPESWRFVPDSCLCKPIFGRLSVN